MITTTDIANILFRDCKVFGISQQFQYTSISQGNVGEERIVIHSKRQGTGVIWRKSFVEVNLVVPDIGEEANLIRLNQLEKDAWKHLKSITGYLDGEHYLYEIDSTEILEDKSFRCHYVNVKILFEVLNC